MPNRRAAVKKTSERAQIDDFLAWFNHRYGTNFKVIDMPRQPDAVVRSSCGTVRWVEMVTVYANLAWARHQFFYATPGETPYPFRGPCEDMDKKLVGSFVTEVHKKLTKDYAKVVEQHGGAGYLLVVLDTPWGPDLGMMVSAWRARNSREDNNCFRSAYITMRQQHQWYRRWSLK